MALVFENSKEFQDNKYTIPRQTGNYFKAQAELLKSQDPHSAIPGHRVVDRLKNDGKAYNEKGGQKNGGKQEAATLSANDAKVIKHRMKTSLNSLGTDSPKNYIYTGEVGKAIEKVCDDAIATAKRKSQQVQAVKPVKPNAAVDTKPATITKTKEISTPNGKISYTVTTECKKVYISESQVIKLKNE
jgi:hypothetical protein